MQVSYADVLARCVPVSVSEGVALVLAAARQLTEEDASAFEGIPGAEHILLSGGGRVTFDVTPDAMPEMEAVRRLTDLLHALLFADASEERPAAGVPGALVLMIARARREIDLPPPSLAELQQVLCRFGSADAVTLASCYRRYAPQEPRVDVVMRPPQTATMLTLPERSAPGAQRAAERRLAGASVDVLRRDLRDLERELFEKEPRGRTAPPRYAAAAVAAVLIAASGAIGWFSPSIMRSTGSPSSVERAHEQSAPSPSLVVRDEEERGNGPAADRAARARTPIAASPATAAAGTAIDRDMRGGLDPAPRSRPAVVPSPTLKSASEIAAHPLLASAVAGGDAFSPSYAPGGDELLFHVGRTHSALMRATFDDRGQPSVAAVVKDGAANFHGVMSPDGRLLAYDSDRDGTRGVYVARIDGGGVRRVSGSGYAAAPRWSPDGRRLAFIKAEQSNARVWNVFVLDLSTSDLRRVSHHTVGQAWAPSWFPDAKQLAYSVEDRLVIVNLQSGAANVIRSPVRGHLIRTPAVSPDGRRMVFQVHGDGVWLLDVTSGRSRRLLNDRSAEEFAWKGDGHAIAYHARRGAAWSLWQVSVPSTVG